MKQPKFRIDEQVIVKAPMSGTLFHLKKIIDGYYNGEGWYYTVGKKHYEIGVAEEVLIKTEPHPTDFPMYQLTK